MHSEIFESTKEVSMGFIESLYGPLNHLLYQCVGSGHTVNTDSAVNCKKSSGLLNYMLVLVTNA